MDTEKAREQLRKQDGGRQFSTPKATRPDTVNTQTAGRKNSKTYSQQPQEIKRGETGAKQLTNGNAIWFPDDLGSESNAYWVKFDVFLLDTDGSRKKVRGDSKTEVGFEEGVKPRFVSGLGTSAGQIRNGALNTPTLKKLAELIALPMPDSLVTDHSTSWSRSEGGMIAATLALGDGLATDTESATNNFMKLVTIGAGQGISNLLSKLGADGAQTALKVLTKRASNPRNEFLFDGVNNRSFNFQWKLIPRSEKEAKQLRLLLEKMKLYMYPELDQSTAGNFYLFPAMFDITFMRGSEENPYLYRTSTCALTNMIVNYAGGGQWVGMAGSGAPMGYDVTLQFTEAEFLHRQRFKSESNPDGVAR